MIVKQILGRKVSFGGKEHSGWLPPGAVTPKSTPIELVELNLRIEKMSDGEGGMISPGDTVEIPGTRPLMTLLTLRNVIFRSTQRSG